MNAGPPAAALMEQASEVASTARQETANLVEQAGQELRTQAQQQTRRLADNLRRLGEQLGQMASAVETGGVQDAARGVASHVQDAASWLEQREPADVVHELQSVGRRRPGTFLLVAGATGFVAGRLLSSMRGSGSQQEAGLPQSAPAAPPVTAPPVPVTTAMPLATDDYLPGAATTEPRTAVLP